jgi:uncharacterized damage-inducible protein DinB
LAQAPELGQGWLPEFNMAARQVLSLAEAMPAEKFAWRPAPGVRSVGEVYVHIAVSNLWFLTQAGVPVDMSKVPSDSEKSITSKPDVIKWLKSSIDAVRENYPKVDRQKKLRFLNKDTTADSVLLRLLVHTNEHMGQSVAYARMCGVVPPWSQ